MAQKRKIVKSLYIVSYGLSFFLDSGKDFAHGYLSIILIELREEPGFQVNPCFNGVRKETPKLIKGYPVRVAMNSLAMIASLSIILLVWDLK